MKEREISIVDLLVEILLHWRMMVVWMMVGAVVFGAFGYMYSGNIVKQQQGESSGILQNPGEGLTEEEIRNVKYVTDCEKVYLEEVAYQEKSPFMQIDFNKVSKAEATIAIVADDRERSYDIEKAYEIIVESSECVAKAVEDNGVEMIGASEMLYLDRILVNDKTNTFKIVALHSDEKTCQAMLTSVVAFLEEKQPDVEGALGEHKIVVVNESFSVVSDMKVASLQETVLTNVVTMKKMLSDAKSELSEKEQSYYAALMSGIEEETDEIVVPETVPSVGGSIKYMILGAVLMAFLYVFILLLIYIFNSKIRAADSFQELYGLPQLGAIPKIIGKKKVLNVIDKWLMSIRNHNKRQFSLDEALELAVIAVKMVARKETLQEISLMGCELKDQSLKVCEKMKARLEEENIHVNILNNVLYDAQMMDELESAKGVVLVETVGVTLYNEIVKEMELINRLQIKILGGILVE